jgi:hypothetical protein
MSTTPARLEASRLNRSKGLLCCLMAHVSEDGRNTISEQSLIDLDLILVEMIRLVAQYPFKFRSHGPGSSKAYSCTNKIGAHRGRILGVKDTISYHYTDRMSELLNPSTYET